MASYCFLLLLPYPGFSYADLDGLTTSQEEVGRDLYNFLIQWFTLFPEYEGNEFFPFGESYAGSIRELIGTTRLHRAITPGLCTV